MRNSSRSPLGHQRPVMSLFKPMLGAVVSESFGSFGSSGQVRLRNVSVYAARVMPIPLNPTRTKYQPLASATYVSCGSAPMPELMPVVGSGMGADPQLT